MAHKVISAYDHIDPRWMPRDLWSERLPVHLRERGPRFQERPFSQQVIESGMAHLTPETQRKIPQAPL